jgi:hypothetical protein
MLKVMKKLLFTEGGVGPVAVAVVEWLFSSG